MDAGSYTKDIVDVVAKNNRLFYIRANRSEGLTKELLENQKWETIEINKIIYEVCSLDFQPFASNVSKAEKKNYPTYRLVVSREKTEDKQIDLLTGDNMKYRSILTNDYKSSEKEVIEYYNKRGAEEKVIDIMNNDFGWSKMPFSYMNENTVFLMIMMICKNVYDWLLGKLSKVFKWLNPNFRMKKFIFRFMTVPAKWVKKSRYNILKIFSKKGYVFLEPQIVK